MEGEEIRLSEPLPVEFLLAHDIISIAAGDYHSAALTSRGFFLFIVILFYFILFILFCFIFVGA